MDYWPSVHGFENGQPISADVLNQPIIDLSERTNYLYDLFTGLFGEGRDFSSVRIPNVTLETDDEEMSPRPGDIVCVNTLTKKYEKAVASTDLLDPFSTNSSAYAVGILVYKNGSTGVVVTNGLINFSADDTDWDLNTMLESGEEFKDGTYYLSCKEPGKITAYPGGPKIRIGLFARNALIGTNATGDFALIALEHFDTSDSHIHRVYPVGSKTIGMSNGVYGLAPVYGNFTVGLKLLGQYLPQDKNAYTFWLSSNESESTEDAEIPSGFPMYLNWSVNGTFSGRTELLGFFRPVDIGATGLEAELTTSSMGSASQALLTFPSVSDETKLTWNINLPDDLCGFSSVLTDYRSVECSNGIGDAVDVAIIPRTQDRQLASDTMLAVSTNTATVVYTTASSVSVLEGSCVTIGDKTYKMCNADTPVEEGEIPVPIGQTIQDCIQNLKDAIGSYYNIAENIAYTGYTATWILTPKSCIYIYSVGCDISVTGSGLSKATSGRSGDHIVFSYINGVKANDINVSSITEVGDQAYVFNSNNAKCAAIVTRKASGSLPEGFFVIHTNFKESAFDYRYNILFDRDLSKFFPPSPLKSISLTKNGLELAPYELFGSDGDFDVDADSVYLKALPDASSKMIFSFTRHSLGCSGPVTSLHAPKDSVIKITDCSTGDPASTGDLLIDADLLANVYDDNVPGYKAVKSGSHGKLRLGPVVEKIVAGPGIELLEQVGVPVGQGTVHIASDGSYSGMFEDVALENAKQEMIGMFPYIRLLGWNQTGSNINSAFVCKFHIPAKIPDGKYKIRVYATVFGETGFTGLSYTKNAGITLDYNILPDFSPMLQSTDPNASLNLYNDIISPDSARLVSIPFGKMNSQTDTYEYAAFDPILIHNDSGIENIPGRSYRVLGGLMPLYSECEAYIERHPSVTEANFAARPGYVVAVRIARTGISEGVAYTDPIGFINLRWSIVLA